MSTHWFFLSFVVWSTFALGAESEEFRPLERPLLEFSNKSGAPIEIPKGSESLLAIHYGEELDPDRFRASLNGRDVTPYFRPEPRASASMKQLPFRLGANQLEFDVWRVPRKDLPKGSQLENELHRVQIVIVKPTADISSARAAGMVSTPPRQK